MLPEWLDPSSYMSPTTFAIALAIFATLTLALKIYGVILAFRKKWYFGLFAIMIPFFADIVALSSLLFKKDLLDE